MMLRTCCVMVVLGCGSEGAQGPEGPVGAAGSAGAMGAPGTKGDPGTDGSLRIYGDGSAGALAVSANGQLLNGVASNGNLQFTDVTIDAGVTLTVPSGVTIRCTGTFINNGTIEVATAASGGITLSNISVFEANATLATWPPHPGVALVQAATGQVGDASQRRVGGFGAEALGISRARLLHPGLVGGGGGAVTAPQTRGGAGGGSLTILAATGIVNAGTISATGADGQLGSGGGAGGVILLASPGDVTNSGTINIKGGTGGAPSPIVAAGGGGGGGILHMITPTPTEGTVIRTGGNGGAATTIAAALRGAGAGGGGCGGSGGQGGSIAPDGTADEGGQGSLGVSTATEVDPTALF